MSNKNVGLINGPNLNMLGNREPDLYGSDTLSYIEDHLCSYAKSMNITLSCFQSNNEGCIVSHIQQAKDKLDYIVLNAGAYSHTSIAIRDALLATKIPFIEVHISNVESREEFRHKSFLSDIATAKIQGLGALGYQAAILAIANNFQLCNK